MASIEELQSSIQQYELQLSQVNGAMQVCSNDTEKASLENLKCDLQEILDLTRETLSELQGSSNTNEELNDEEDPYAQEMAIFMAELNECRTSIDKTTTENSADQTPNEVDKFKNEIDTIIGKKVTAPYTFAWGARSYHNALVCGLETDINHINSSNSMNDIKVIVLFTNPIHRNMVPCPYYLDGNCRFELNKCRFSHGEIVRYADLKEYNKPNFSLLNKIKHPVLAKQSDNIWYKGRVVSSDFNEKTCQIKLDHSKKEIKCDFHDILPIEEETPFIASDSEASDEDDVEQILKANLIATSLLTPASNERLGAWEVHTKGFGSRILQKFGYVVGNGLGQNGEGIVVPISAQVLPPGRSLDHCMALREQANGDKDLFSVERKLKRQQERQETISAKAYEREKQNQDIFNFLNQNILNNMPSTSGNQNMIKDLKRPKLDIKSQTNRKLNVESLKIGEDIRKMEKEIQKLQESLRRHQDGTHISQQLNMQLDIRKTELDRMKKSEICLQKEQNLRKDKSKLTIF